MRTSLMALVVALPLAFAGNAHALSVEVDGAGGYWFAGTPQFQLRLGLQQRLAQLGSSAGLYLAFHSGVFVNTVGPRLGIPVDLALELHVSRVSFGVVGGPWFHFNDGELLRAHVGGEFAFRFAKICRVSLEVGWLQPSPLLLLRFGVMVF
jgi:hypothetical protein